MKTRHLGRDWDEKDVNWACLECGPDANFTITSHNGSGASGYVPISVLEVLAIAWLTSALVAYQRMTGIGRG